MTLRLAGDIGGTKTILRLVDAQPVDAVWDPPGKLSCTKSITPVSITPIWCPW